MVDVSNPACGDILRLSVAFENGAVAVVRFKVRGCPASIACGSALTEWLMGKRVAEIESLDAAVLDAAVGGLIPESKHAAVLCLDAVKKLLSTSASRSRILGSVSLTEFPASKCRPCFLATAHSLVPPFPPLGRSHFRSPVPISSVLRFRKQLIRLQGHFGCPWLSLTGCPERMSVPGSWRSSLNTCPRLETPVAL